MLTQCDGGQSDWQVGLSWIVREVLSEEMTIKITPE